MVSRQTHRIPSVESSLPKWVYSYVAGLVDNHTSIVVSVARASNRTVGYRPKQEIRYKTDKRPVIELLKRYCIAQKITPRISKQSGTTYPRFTFELAARDEIIAFLEPLRPYLVCSERPVTLLVDVLLPGLKAAAHTDAPSFLAWMRFLDVFRETFGRANRNKYDYDYFREEFDVDPYHLSVDSFAWLPDELHDTETSIAELTAAEIIESLKRRNTIDGRCPELITPYVAALIDDHFDFVISIGKQETSAVGYKIHHRLQYNAEGQQIVRLLKSHLTLYGIEPRVREQSDTKYDHYELTIRKRDDISTVLTELKPYIIAQEEAVTHLLDEIIPALNRGAHTNRGSFVELAGEIDRFREAAGRANRAKYTQDYFTREWNHEIGE